MAYFKQLVSKKKRRFRDDGFDLDLTYIKPNIVAMGFPSEKLEGVYRNHIDEVFRFFETRHRDHYKVYNLSLEIAFAFIMACHLGFDHAEPLPSAIFVRCSERTYDPAKFHDRVATYAFDDHNAPPFALMGPFCDDVDNWLTADDHNVAVIHCKAGKGRTGVMICAYLLHNGFFKSTEEALKYYGDARTSNAKGVTIPSQRRYVLYYGHMLRKQLSYIPTMVLLKAITIHAIPNFNAGTCSPMFLLWQQKVKIFSSRVIEGVKKTDDSIIFDLRQPLPVCGDIKVECFHKDRWKKERMFQFWFNTFFISKGQDFQQEQLEPTLRVNRSESESWWFEIPKQDIDKAHKDDRNKVFPSNFKVRVCFSIVDAEESSAKNNLVVPKKHKRKTNSLGSNCSFDRLSTDGALTEDSEDNFSGTDDEEEWNDAGYAQITHV